MYKVLHQHMLDKEALTLLVYDHSQFSQQVFQSPYPKSTIVALLRLVTSHKCHVTRVALAHTCAPTAADHSVSYSPNISNKTSF